jgi:hypothetical protein
LEFDGYLYLSISNGGLDFMNRRLIGITMPNLCVWCGSEHPIKTISVIGSHSETRGFIIRKVRTQTLDLKLPICSSCDEKMVKGSQVRIRALLLLGVAGTIFCLWFGNLVDENILLCGFFGIIFSFGGATYFSEFLIKILGYPVSDNWGKYDGLYLYFKNGYFAKQFHQLNPHLSRPNTRNY